MPDPISLSTSSTNYTAGEYGEANSCQGADPGEAPISLSAAVSEPADTSGSGAEYLANRSTQDHSAFVQAQAKQSDCADSVMNAALACGAVAPSAAFVASAAAAPPFWGAEPAAIATLTSSVAGCLHFADRAYGACSE